MRSKTSALTYYQKPAAAAMLWLFLLHACAPCGCTKPDSAGSTTTAAKQDVVVVHQISDAFGKTDLYLSADAGRFVARDGDVTITSSAPSWKLVLYSRSKNQGYAMNEKEEKTSALGLLMGSLSSNNGRAVKSNEMPFGYACTKIFITPGGTNVPSLDMPIFQDRSKRIIHDTTLKLVTPCKIKPRLQDYIDWLYNLSTRFTGLPLESKTTFTDKTSSTTFRTVSIEHTTKPSSFFAYSTGFKPAPNAMDLLISDELKGAMIDLWGSVPKKGK